MSGFISQETINNVRDVSDIISVIGEYTKLEINGGGVVLFIAKKHLHSKLMQIKNFIIVLDATLQEM